MQDRIRILETTDTSVEDRTSFISTAQLYSGVEHLFSGTVGACFLNDSLGLPVVGRQSLDGRSLGSQ